MGGLLGVDGGNCQTWFEENCGKVYVKTVVELTTVLIEIESTLNNRPLTYLYSHNEGALQLLTPAHLIYGWHLTSSPSSHQKG